MAEIEALQLIRQHSSGFLLSRAIHAVTDLGIPDVLGEASEPAELLAQKVGVHPDALQRILRLLAGHGIFRETASRSFVHTDQSRVLRSDHPQSMRAFLCGVSAMSWKLATALPETLRTGQSAAATLAPGGVFEYLANHPKEARLFDEAMTSKANADIPNLLQAYDFSSFDLIADIGGGYGHLIKAILARTPNARGILFDLPHVLKNFAELASQRLTVQPGDFFTDTLPACDVYLLMNVIHDWADTQARSILQAVHRPAPKNSKLLVIEAPMPERPEPGPVGAHPAVWADAFMLIWSTGRERSRSQYETLLKQGGFGLTRVIPTAGPMGVLECTPRP
jgi:hypothetical protein